MSYTKTNWVNGVTPLNAANMNNIEDGIYNVNEEVIGIRTGADGIIYESAGEAIQTQTKKLFKENERISNIVSSKRYEGSIKAIPGKPIYASKKLIEAHLKQGERLELSANYDSSAILQITGFYLIFADNTTERILDFMAPNVKYYTTLKSDIIGFSIYVLSENILTESSIEIYVETINPKSLERLSSVFSWKSLTEQDLEYGSIENGTGNNIFNGNVKRTRTIGFFPAFKGDIIESTLNINMYINIAGTSEKLENDSQDEYII